VISDDSALGERAEIARQAGATYQSTASLAWMVRLAVVAATIATLAMVVFDVWAMSQAPDAGIVGGITWLLGEDLATGLVGEDLEPGIVDEEFDPGIVDEDPQPRIDAEIAGLGLIVTLAVGAVWLAAFAVWAWWLSRVVANVPALGGGWTGTGPVAAFISAVVPVSNLVWGTAVLRDAMVRLAPPERARPTPPDGARPSAPESARLLAPDDVRLSAPDGARLSAPENARLSAPDGARLSLLTVWWIALVLAILPWVGAVPAAGAVRLVFRLVAASFAGIVSAIAGIEVTAEQMVEVVAGLLMILAAGLAITLVDHVENLQETRAKALPAPA
jgi:hypothetical protein